MKPLQLFGSSPTMWLTLEKLIQQVMWLILFLILAPILGPKPYGLFTIVMAFLGFCELVIVGATVEALVTHPGVTDDHLRTGNLAAMIAAVAAAVVAFVAAGPMATIFDAAELAPLFRALAPLPIISALTVSPTALLLREMRFRAFALRSTVGLLSGGAAAVALALYGAGVWALVMQILIQRVVELLLLWSSARTPLGFAWSKSHYLDLRGYAASVGISKAMAWSGGQIPRLILGWYLGPTDLGLFSLAGRMAEVVAQVFIVPLAWVARLTLRRLAEDLAGFAGEFRLVLRQIGFVAFPVCVGLAAIMPYLFARFLDQRWIGGVAPTQIMALMGIPAAFYYLFTAAVLAVRQPRLDSRVAVATNSTTALAVLLAAPFGLYASCLAMLAQRIMLMPLPLVYLRRAIGVSPAAIVLTQLPILGAAIAMGAMVTLVAPAITNRLGLSFGLVILMVVGVCVYVPLALVAAPDIGRMWWNKARSFGSSDLGAV
jgi:O-antigen/teichoic acid export membrane protein